MISEVFGPSGGAQTHEPRGPKPRVLSTELHPEIQKYHTRKNRKSNFIVVKIVAKAMQLGTFDFLKSHKSPVAQGFPGFLKNYLNIIQQRPKAGALPTALHPGIFIYSFNQSNSIVYFQKDCKYSVAVVKLFLL